MESCFLLKPTRNENTQCLDVVDFVELQKVGAAKPRKGRMNSR